jgi:predicted MPP superfamily phosphohydrolase
LYLAGVDDYGYGADLRRAMRGIPRDAATVLLAHNPRMISLASRHGVSLVLSGHTHGGQVNIPLLGTVYGRSPQRLRYKIGWDRLGTTQIYVSRGIGTIVLPWRLRCPAEITHLELLQSIS